MRGVHRGGAGEHAHGGAGVGVIAEPGFPGAQRAGAVVPGVALFGGRVGGGGVRGGGRLGLTLKMGMK